MSETYISNQNDFMKAAMSRGLRLKDPISKDAAMKTAVNCQKEIDEKNEELKFYQERLLKVSSNELKRKNVT